MNKNKENDTYEPIMINFRQALEYMNKHRKPVSLLMEKERTPENIMSADYALCREELRNLLEKGYIKALGVKGKIIISSPMENYPEGNFLRVITDYNYEKEAIKLFSDKDIPHLKKDDKPDSEFEPYISTLTVLTNEEKINKQLIKNCFTVEDVYLNCYYEGELCRSDYPMARLQYKSNIILKDKETIEKSRYAKRELVEPIFIQNNDIDWERGIIGKNVDVPVFEDDGIFETEGYAYVVVDFENLITALTNNDNKLKKINYKEEILKYAYELFPKPVCASHAADRIIERKYKEASKTTLTRDLNKADPEHFFITSKRGHPKKEKSLILPDSCAKNIDSFEKAAENKKPWYGPTKKEMVKTE